MKINKIIFILILCTVGLVACRENYAPKPRGYFRITFPNKAYKPLELPLPYQFQIPVYAYAEKDSIDLDQPDWITIQVPANHAQIHLSYKKLDNNLGRFIEESRTLAYKHAQKASAIEEQIFMNPSQHVYGTIYSIKGNAASPVQFYLTDSIRNFIRGSLYIKEVPDIDSLQPVIAFLSQDVLELIKTAKWKTTK